MKILALEFSSEERSVATADAPAQEFVEVLGAATETGGRSVKALGMVETALQQAKLRREQIDCIAVGLGPGSYTGIRAAISLAQGWQFALAVKLLGISSVECLASQAQAAGLVGDVTFIIDAQRGEFYLAEYTVSSSAMREISSVQIVSRLEVEKHIGRGHIVVGPQADTHFPGYAKNLFPDARALARLAAGRTNFVSAEKLEPIYLREAQFVKAPPRRAL